MADSIIHDQVAMERVLYVIEESMEILDRSRFYNWAQGAMQGLLPHGILVCAYGDLASLEFNCKTFSGVADDPKMMLGLADPVEGLLSGIIERWLGTGRKPLIYAERSGGKEGEPTAAGLRRIGGGYALAHGAGEISNSEGSFFLLLQMPHAPTSREGYLIDLLMPHLHMALYRMLRAESEIHTRPEPVKSALSEREEEVLRWVGQGKTNQEIGGLLDISPLTVKNHLQKILRKLRVNNRAQAVFMANLTNRTGVRGRKRDGK